MTPSDGHRDIRILTCTMIVVLSTATSTMADDDTDRASGLYAATFSVDVTPPLGQPIGLGFIPILQTVEHPLLARGILLRDSNTTCAICTVDWMEVHNESYDFLRQQIAEAAGIDESHVALHCLHQHTAPAIGMAAQRLQLEETDPRRIASAEYLLSVAEKIEKAIQHSCNHWQPVTHLATGRAKVEHVASSRRLELADGTIQGRSSSTQDEKLHAMEEGRIDPWVRTVSLENPEGAVAQLHYYASHPQSYYGDGRASSDVPGIVRDRIEQRSGIFQLYVTGCGGDIAFGKYNNGSKEARERLTDRLQAGIEQSIANLKHQPIEPLQWSVTDIHFPLRQDAAFSESTNRNILADRTLSEGQRRKAAIAVAWIERVHAQRPVQLSCLTIGSIRMLHLPGEPFVQFQLEAQAMRPNEFVCVAGYGDCGMGYIGGDRIYTDRGGYEQTYAFAGPSEQLMLEAMRDLLNE